MSTVRLLTADERALLAGLIGDKPEAARLLDSLPTALVEEMDDGGMGSLRFSGPENVSRRLGEQLVEKEFADIDGVPVIVAINLDDRGDLYELDVWKVDFSPLKRFPAMSK